MHLVDMTSRGCCLRERERWINYSSAIRTGNFHFRLCSVSGTRGRLFGLEVKGHIYRCKELIIQTPQCSNLSFYSSLSKQSKLLNLRRRNKIIFCSSADTEAVFSSHLSSSGDSEKKHNLCAPWQGCCSFSDL